MKLRTILLLLATTIALGLNAQGHVERPGKQAGKPHTETPKPKPKPHPEPGLTPEQMFNKGWVAYEASNYGEAVKWFHKAAEQGDATAQYYLGYCHENGYGVSQDYNEAIKWYTKAAEQDHSTAQFYLADCYRYGKGVSIDYNQAIKWYNKAAEQNALSAQLSLAVLFYSEKEPLNYSEAVKWFYKVAERAATTQVWIAHFYLGLCYYRGYGVQKNYYEAIKYWREAAEHGENNSKEQLMFFESQKLTPKQLTEIGNEAYAANDFEDAVSWYKKSAELNDSEAQYYLGCWYNNTQDYHEAVKWFRMAAVQGFADAQFNLGYCCENGHGVTQDYNEAAKWYRKAAEQGEAAAQFNLGTCYENGQGVTQDYNEAVNWYRLAAEQGDDVAQAALDYLKRKGYY